MVHKLVLLRHGESTWNELNIFTGWTDVPLTEKGRKESLAAAKELEKAGYKFDVAYTSVLKRAVCTCWSVLEHTNQCYVPVINSWRLNERHYGALQGLNKSETAEKHGEEQVKIWRRSYNIPPPVLEPTDERHPANQEMYKSIMKKEECPATESLEICVARVLPFWYDTIAPAIKAGKKVLVTAHGNSLRGLVKHLDNLSEKEVIELNIPTGQPLVYELDDNLKPIKHYYLGDQDEIKKREEEVASQGKKKN